MIISISAALLETFRRERACLSLLFSSSQATTKMSPYFETIVYVQMCLENQDIFCLCGNGFKLCLDFRNIPFS